MEELDFNIDSYSDIVAKDPRFHARAYTLLMDVVNYLSGPNGEDITGEDILEEFRERTLDLFGPLSFRVLTEWGVTCTEDIGEMMLNLVDARRIGRGKSDNIEAFSGGYDFTEAFLTPYET